MTKINLEFPKSETRLAGFPYGEEVYNKQVKGKISFDGMIQIIFPKQIEKVASSFVQGFFAAIISQIGYKGVEEKVEILTENNNLKESIWKNLY